jgi:uncharacterized protein (DUF3084 family)
LTASVSGNLAGDDVASEVGDVDTPSKRSTTPRGSRRERDLPPAGFRDKKEEQIRNLEAQIKEIRNETRSKTEDLRRQEERAKSLAKEKQLLEQKFARFERNKTDEVSFTMEQ